MRKTSALLVALVALVACSAAPGDEPLESVRQPVVTCPGAQTLDGVDVSHWEGAIDWTKVKAAGQSFGIAKATQGTYYTDDQFAPNWKNMKGAGIIRGAFHFLDYTEDAIKQADYFLGVLDKNGGFAPGDLPPVLDVEETPASGGGFQTPSIKKVLPWLQHVECATGRRPMIYTRASFIDPLNPPAELAGYPLWIAHYTSGCPNTPALWKSWDFWQYSDAGKISGISSAVDINKFNGTLADLMAFANQSSQGCGGSGSGGSGSGGSGSGGSAAGKGGSGGSGASGGAGSGSGSAAGKGGSASGGSPGGGGSGSGSSAGKPGAGGSGSGDCATWIPPSGLVLEETDPCVLKSGDNLGDTSGHEGHAYQTAADVPAPDYADGVIWQLQFTQAGSYRLRAWIPASGPELIGSTSYKVQHSGGAQKIEVNQAKSEGGWADLGVFDFASGTGQWVRLGDYYSAAGDKGKTVAFDALEITPEGGQGTAGAPGGAGGPGSAGGPPGSGGASPGGAGPGGPGGASAGGASAGGKSNQGGATDPGTWVPGGAQGGNAGKGGSAGGKKPGTVNIDDETSEQESGCSCSAAGAAAPRGWAAFALAALCLARRGARRR